MKLAMVLLLTAALTESLPEVHYSFSTKSMDLALTFDDGPLANNTPKVLDILSAHGVKATFFLLGENMSGNEAIIKRIVREGHEIGLHTYSHPNFYKLSAAQIESEIDRNIELLQSIINYTPKIIRPPYGIVTKSFLKIAKKRNLTIVSWSNDSLDWKKNHGAKQIYDDALAKIHPGAVILMHDKSANYRESVKSLPRIIERLQSDGYSFRTVSEFL